MVTVDGRDLSEVGDQAGEHSPLLQARADQQVLGDLLALERLRSQRVGDLLDALALERVARRSGRRAAAAPGTGEPRRSRRRRRTRRRGAGRPRAAAKPGRSSPSRSSASWMRAGSFWPVATTISAPAVSSASVGVRGAARPVTTIRRLSGAARTSCDVQRQSRVGVEDDARRLLAHGLDAGRQLRVVGQRRADADGDGVDRARASDARERGSTRPRSTASRRCASRPCRRASSPT